MPFSSRFCYLAFYTWYMTRGELGTLYVRFYYIHTGEPGLRTKPNLANWNRLESSRHGNALHLWFGLQLVGSVCPEAPSQ